MLKTVFRLFVVAVAVSLVPGTVRAGAARVELNSEMTTPAPPAQSRSRGSRALPGASVKLEAQTVAVAAGLDCQVASAISLGRDPVGRAVYEVTCVRGPGYLLHDGYPPRGYDCVALAGQADASAARAPAAPLLATCRMTANRNVLAVLREFAREAGIACEIDEGAMAGQSPTGARIYEIGCDGVDGSWLEQTATGWTTTECLVVRAQNGTCRFSTEDEGVTTVRAWVAGAGPACDITRVRYMGGSADGAFYEVGCAMGPGSVIRLDAARAVQDVLPCPDATHVGGGCTLAEASARP